MWNQSVVRCQVLIVASWPAYRFLWRQVRWSGIPISLRIFYSLLWSTVKDFHIVNEEDVFLEFSCFFYDPMDVGNLISCSSAFYNSVSLCPASFCTWRLRLFLFWRKMWRPWEQALQITNYWWDNWPRASTWATYRWAAQPIIELSRDTKAGCFLGDTEFWSFVWAPWRSWPTLLRLTILQEDPHQLSYCLFFIWGQTHILVWQLS